MSWKNNGEKTQKKQGLVSFCGEKLSFFCKDVNVFCKGVGMKVWMALFAGFLIFNIVHSSFVVVDEGERGVILTFGEISRTIDSGLHFRIPVVQTVKKYNVRVQKSVFGQDDILSAYSFDQQIIESYRISITYQYNPNKIEEIYRMFGTGDESLFATVVLPIVQQTTKGIFGRFTAQTIVQERARLEEVINESLSAALANYPIAILGIQLEDVNFSRSYEKIIEQTAQKKQEIEKSKNELQRIEIEARQQVVQAEAKKEAMRLEAEAKAYQIATQAKAEADAIRNRGEAEADAIRKKGEALKENPNLVNLSIAEKWNGSVPQTLMGGAEKQSVFPMLQLNK